MASKFVDDMIAENERITKMGEAVSMEIAEAKNAMEKANG